MTGLSDSQKRKLASNGTSASSVEAISENVDRMTKRLPEAKKKDDSWNDTMLMQPTEAWDRTDRKGRWGDKVLSTPSKKYKERYELIDWSK